MHFNVRPDAFLLEYLPVSVDYAVHDDAGADPQRCGGLRGGRLLWAECGCVSAASMVRISQFQHSSSSSIFPLDEVKPRI